MNDKMSYYEAAKLIVEMLSDLRISGFNDRQYDEAVAVACGVLMERENGK